MKLSELTPGKFYMDTRDPWAWDAEQERWCFLDAEAKWIAWPGQDTKGLAPISESTLVDLATRRALDNAVAAIERDLKPLDIQMAMTLLIDDLKRFQIFEVY